MLEVVQAIHSWPQGIAVVGIAAAVPASLWVFFYWLNELCR